MALWKKPNGTQIETNDLEKTIEYAKSLDWKRLKNKLKGDPQVDPKTKQIIAE